MKKRRAKTLNELYALTKEISQPEITPILEGTCHMQGPVDELEDDIQMTLDLCSPEKRLEKHCSNESLHMKTESGTCNVCSAPCSSCMHFNQAFSIVESKGEGGFSNSGCGRREADHCSFVNADPPSCYKSRSCDNRQHAASETSSLFNASSSHDSFSENAESKAVVRNLDTNDDASEDVDMPLKAASHEAVEEDQHLAEKEDDITQSMLPSHIHAASDMLLETFSSRGEEHYGLECNGDNISCVEGIRDAKFSVSGATTNLDRKSMPFNATSHSIVLAEGIEVVAQVQTADDETEDSQSNSRMQSTTKGIEVVAQVQTKFCSSNAGNSLKSGPAEGALSNENPSPKEQSTHSCSQSRETLRTAGSKDLEENSSSQLGEFGKLTSSVVNGQKSTPTFDSNNLASYEDNKASHVRSVSSSEAVKNSHQCMETETGTDGGSSSNMQGPQMQPQPMAQSDKSDQEILEDDVKVCDICGDTGREELLAICSRCIDGAEHTYCMQNMLDKVPEGDWLCEECKLKKEDANQKGDSSETMSEMSKAVCIDEKPQNVGDTFNPKILPRLDVKAFDSEAPPSVKGLKSLQISMKGPSEDVDVTSVSDKKSPETCGGFSGTTASPSRKTILSRGNSSKKLDSIKVKPANLGPPSRSQSINNFQAVSRSLTLSSPKSSRVQAQLQSPRGCLTKSSSFNTFKPKVKQVIEIVPQKPNVVRESPNNDTKKEGLVRTISKSASSKNMSLSRLNVNEQSSKTQSLNPPQLEESRNLRLCKERIALERKSSLPQLNSSSVSATSVPPLKVEMKVARFDEKSTGLSESNAIIAHKGSKDALGMVKKQPSYPSKTFGSSSDWSCNLEDQNPCQVASREVDRHVLSQSWQASNHDEKNKEFTAPGSSRQSVSTGGRVSRCHRCNETGHSTEFCSVDKLWVSAVKPSTEQNSRESGNKDNKWKDAVDAVISKSRIRNTSRLVDQSEGFSLSSTNLSNEIISKDQISGFSSCIRDLTTLEGIADRQDNSRCSTAEPSKTTSAVNMKKETLYPLETICSIRDGETNTVLLNAEDSKVKLPMQMFPKRDFVLDPPRVSAIPEHEFMWQGGFEVQRMQSLPELCDGVQAHLSTCASPKVLEVVAKFPSKIHLEEVPWLSMWPLQFQENCPTEENIALFFFAKDVESYEKNYMKLLENMLKYDLALKGSLDGTELLIFPSSKLPKNSQRWNRSFFLWGVFRRSSNCLEPFSRFQNTICESNLNVENIVEDLPSQLTTEVAGSQKVSSHEHTVKELSRYNKPSKTEVAKSTVDFPHLSSLEAEGKSCHSNEPSSLKALYQAAVDNELPPDMHSSYLVSGCLPSTKMSQQTSSPSTCPESKIGMSSAQLCSELNVSSTCLNEFIGTSERNKDVEHPLRFQISSMQIDRNMDIVLPAHLVTPDYRQIDFSLGPQGRQGISSDSSRVYQQSSSILVQGPGVVGGRDEEKVKDIERLMERETASDSEAWGNNTKEVSWELRPNRKRAHSYSPEPVLQVSSELTKGASANMLWEEKPRHISDDEVRDSKRVKIYTEAHDCGSSEENNFSERLSSKVHPLLADFFNAQLHIDSVHNQISIPETTRNSERYFFPEDSGSVIDKSGNLIPLQVLSSDDEDQQESDIPNLDLALGVEKKSQKPEIMPLFFPLVDKKNSCDKIPYPADDVVDDVPASLSLSLAFPFSERERATKPVPNTEQLLPGRPRVNTSLLL